VMIPNRFPLQRQSLWRKTQTKCKGLFSVNLFFHCRNDRCFKKYPKNIFVGIIILKQAKFEFGTKF
jgi:hypothetical protein